MLFRSRAYQHGQLRSGDRIVEATSGNTGISFAALGRAAGLEGATVRQRADLGVVAAWLDAGAAPALVLDAKVVPTVVAEWLEEAFRGH